jgi:lipid-binding SYLF domain-containing protein
MRTTRFSILCSLTFLDCVRVSSRNTLTHKKEDVMRNRFTSMLMAAVVAVLMAAPVMANEKYEKEDKAKRVELVSDAEQVLRDSVSAPDKRIPQELLEKAECIGVFPKVAKGAFVVGGEYGKGVFTCRQPDGTMSAPAFFSIGGPSVGFQVGGSSTDLVLLIMNEKGVDHLLKDKFTMGGEAAAVAGPVGRNAQAMTDAMMHAQILSWSRSRGAFLGASLEGMIVNSKEDANHEFYGKPLTARQILVDHSVEVPAAAKSFVKTASSYTVRSSS